MVRNTIALRHNREGSNGAIVIANTRTSVCAIAAAPANHVLPCMKGSNGAIVIANTRISVCAIAAPTNGYFSMYGILRFRNKKSPAVLAHRGTLSK